MDGSNQWYMAIGGHQVGPVSQQEIITNLQNGSIDAETLVFTAGMTQWQKLKDVPAFASFVRGTAAAPGQAPGAFVPPPAPGRRAHDIDFEVHGNEMQFVEVQLDPGEGAVAEDRFHGDALRHVHHRSRFSDRAFTRIELDLDELHFIAVHFEVDVVRASSRRRRRHK